MNDFIAGLVGGTMGLVVGHPLDTVKAVMQTRGQTSMIASTKNIIKSSNLKGFFRGLALPFISYGPLNSLTFGVYANSLRFLETNEETTTTTNKQASLGNMFLAGTISGFIACFPTTPLELIKIQLQTHDKGEIRSLRECTRNIIKQHGFKGLSRGLLTLIYRDSLSYGAYFYLFEFTRRKMKQMGSKQEILNDLIAGGMAGAITWTCVIPIDIVKSQIQSDMSMKVNMREILGKMYEKHGFRGYFVGAWPAAIRGFIVNAVTFCGYIQVLKLLDNHFKSLSQSQ